MIIRKMDIERTQTRRDVGSRIILQHPGERTKKDYIMLGGVEHLGQLSSIAVLSSTQLPSIAAQYSEFYIQW